MSRTRGAVLTAVIAAVALYVVPSIVERALLYTSLNVWLVCVVFADLPGAVVLYLLRFRKTAIGVYVLTTLLESYLLTHGVSPFQLIWLTNLMPALVAGFLIFILMDFNPDSV